MSAQVRNIVWLDVVKAAVAGGAHCQDTPESVARRASKIADEVVARLERDLELQKEEGDNGNP